MSDLIGKIISQYQIVELIRETESSTLYKGFQPNMNRYVAVDILKSHAQADIHAFTEQSQLLVEIQHTNILPIYDSGQADGQAYRAQRYAEGGLLENHLMQYYDVNRAVGLFSGIVAGLEQIHAKGWVHGNLQPGNIFLDETGQPMLTDFGMPKAPGAAITPYMSPEQVQGGVVDKRSDVYALGVLLYTLLIGETPPAGVVVSPRAKRADLPESVEKVILKAMAQNPEARFQSASEFQHALTSALQPVVPMQTSSPQTYQQAPPPSARRGTNWAAIILGVILAVVICGGIFLVFNWWSNRPVEGVPAEPVQPPAEIVPTEIPEQPQEPLEPAEPVEPPEEVQPPDDSSGEEAPSEPDEGGQPVQLPAVCNSGGFAGGFFVLGSFLMIRKRSSSKRKQLRE